MGSDNYQYTGGVPPQDLQYEIDEFDGQFSNGRDNPVVSGAGTSLNQGEGEPGFIRLEPLISPQRIKDEFLFGVPLVATLTGQTLPDGVVDSAIRKAVGDFETSVRIAVSPVRVKDHCDFERADDLCYGTRQLTRWPVLKVEHLRALWPGRNDILAQFDQGLSGEVDYPTSWVSLQGDMGLIRIVPNTGSIVAADASFLCSSAYRSIVLGGLKSWPNMWRITYIAGFHHDKIPCVVNDLIGTIAAKRLLSLLAPAIFPVNSMSTGIDGLSQSTGTAGPMWLQLRMKELTDTETKLTAQLRAHFGTDILFAAF
jgi:hypothetical protein